MGIRGILFEVTPLKNGVPTTINMTRWGAESNATQVNGKQWLPIITQRHQSSMAIASSGQLTAPTTSWGGLTVALGPDFGNQEIGSYTWVGQQGRIWVGDEDEPFSNWTLKFTGTVGSIEHQNNKATIQLLGPEADLTGNLLSLSYAGTGGIEGTPDMMGTLKPRAFGTCLTVAPVQIDPVYLVYQVHGYGPIISFPHVYEFAQSLDGTKNKGNAASYSDLIAMTLKPGEWATCTAQGLFRLGAQPKNKISADVVASAGTVAEVGRQILKAGGVADARIGDLSAFASKPFCLYAADEVSVLDAARDTFLQGGGYLFADGASVWQVGDYFATKTPIVVNDDMSTTPIVRSIKELPSSTPVWKVRVGFDKCWSVHSESDVSPALSAISDQQLADAAAVEQAIEDAALAVAEVATAKARIAAMDSDGILTPSEKLDVVRRLQDIQAEYTGLANQGSQFNITDKKHAYVTAYNNLISYANALTPSLYDMTQDTPVNPAQDEAIWDIFYSARADLRVALTGGAATWTNITGPGKPADNADVTGDNTSKDTNAVGGVPAGTVIGAITDNSGRIVTVDELKAATTAVQAEAATARSDAAAASAEAAQVRAELVPEVVQAQTDVTTARSDLTAEVQRAKDDTASIRTVTTQLQTDVSGNTSRITAEETNRATAIAAIADRTTALEVAFNDPSNDDTSAIVARLSTEETTRASADGAISDRTTKLETTVNDPATGLVATSAKLTEEVTTRADAISALTSRTAVLESSINDPANNDTSAIIARISTEETTRATKDAALSDRAGALESTVNNPTTGVAAANARIASEETTRADQISAVANRTYTLESRTGNTSNYASANASFTAWPDGSPLPSQWAYWNPSGTYTREGSTFQSGAYMVGHNLPSTNDGGLSTSFYVSTGPWVLEASLWCSAGTYEGAGVYVDNLPPVKFAITPDNSGTTGVGGPGIRQWSVLVNSTFAGQVNLYAMTNWVNFGTTTPKTLHWLKVGARPATAGEIIAQKADATLNASGGIVARMSQEETTRADQVSSLANQTNSLQTSFSTLKSKPNLLGSLNDWSGIAGFYNSPFWGPVRQFNGVQGDYEQLFAASPGVSLAANTTYTLSCDLLALGDYSPYATMDVICYDANNNITLDSNNTASINADFSDGRAIGEIAVSFTTPGNTSYGIVRLLGNTRNGNCSIGCRKVKLEFGGYATSFNSDQAVNANNAAIKEEATTRSDQYGSLASRSSSLESNYSSVRNDLNNWNNDRANENVQTNSRIANEETTRSNQTSALSDRTGSLEASLSSVNSNLNARIANEETARANQDSAIASRTYTLEASVKTGGNLLPSSSFATTVGWGPATSNPSIQSGINQAGDDWHPVNENALSFYQPNNDGSLYAYWYSDLIAVSVGKWYQFSCYVASHRADSGLGCENWSADGQTNYGLATPVRIQRGSGQNGGRDLRSWDLVYFNYQAWQPAFKMNLWKWGTNNGNGDSFAWFCRPQLVEVASGDAPLVPYSPASGSAAINNAVARVSTTEAALSDVRGRSSSYWQVLSVSGDNRAQLTVHSDSNGGAGVDIVGDVRITGQNGNGTSVVSNTGFRVYYPNGQIAVDLGI